MSCSASISISSKLDVCTHLINSHLALAQALDRDADHVRKLFVAFVDLAGSSPQASGYAHRAEDAIYLTTSAFAVLSNMSRTVIEQETLECLFYEHEVQVGQRSSDRLCNSDQPRPPLGAAAYSESRTEL